MTGDSRFDRSPVIVNRHTLQIINRKSSSKLHWSIASRSRISLLVIQTCDLWRLKHSPQIVSYSMKDRSTNKHLIVKLKNKYFIKQIAIMFMIRVAVIYEKNSFALKSLAILSSRFYFIVETHTSLSWWIFYILSDETLTATYIR